MSNEPAQWVQIQKKTFTKWVNSHLRRRFGSTVPVIENIESELDSGIQVYRLINALYDRPMPKKYNQNPKMRPHQLDNCAMAVTMIEEAGIKLNFFRPDHLVDHDLKMILGMIWAVILDYQIKGISVEELSAKEGLLLWCQKKTEGYAHVKVENFHTSFQNGLAFCALIHRHRPDLLDYDALSPDDPRHNLELAFQVAEEKLNIPRLLDVEDIVDVARPDERSVMTYVSEYFHCFASQNQQEIAGRRIAKVVKLTQSNDQLKHEYGEKAAALASWIAGKTVELQERSFDNTIDGVRAQINDFGDYRRNVKPEKTAEKLAVEQLFNNITFKLRAIDRPAFEPRAGESVADLNRAWEALETAESERGAALRDELARQERLEQLAARFNTKAGVFLQWATTKRTLLQSLEGERFSTVGQVAARTQMLDAFDAEVAAAAPRLAVLGDIESQLVGDNYRESGAVSSRAAEARELYASLQHTSGDRRGALSSELVLQNRQEDLRKEFARQAKDFDRWLKDAAEVARDTTTFGESLDEVERSAAELDSNESSALATSGEKRAALDQLDADLKAAGVTYNMYTNLTVTDIDERQRTLEQLLAARRDAYAAELARQRAMEEKRKEFAAAAQQFVDYLAEQRARISSVDGEPEDQIAAIRELHNSADGQARLDAIRALDAQMRDMGIAHNQHTKYSSAALTTRLGAFENFVQNFLDNLDQDVALKRRAAENAAEWQRAQRTEEMRNEFAKRAAALGGWLQTADDVLSEPIVASSPEDVDALQSAFDTVAAELPAKTDERHGLDAYSQELVAAGITENPLAEFTIEQLDARFDAIVAKFDQRRSDLAAEADRQRANDALAREFADKASAVGASIDAKLAQLSALDGTEEAQLEQLAAISLDQAPVDELFEIDQRVQDAGVRFNRHTSLTAEALGAKWTALLDSVSEKRKTLDSAIAARSHSEVPAEQLQEIQECFRKFDKESTGGLARHEFKACLSALGENISDAAIDALFSGNVNANNEIEMDAFVSFMINRLKDTDTEQQIIDSFKVIAGDRTFVTENELRMVFREHEDIGYLLAQLPKADGVEGGYDYVAFTKAIFAR